MCPMNYARMALLGSLSLPWAWSEPQMLPREWGGPLSLEKVILVVPPGEAGELLRDALEETEAVVEVIPPEAALAENGLQWKPEVLASTVILLGGIHTNRAMLPLYIHYLSFGDAAYPGGQGFVIRTIARPFGAGTAAIALEASTAAPTRPV